jgi:RimJ/RimL family protein N-acetyltransferase
VPRSDLCVATERLELRRFVVDDLEWLVELYRDPDVMQHVGGPQDRPAVEELLHVRMLDYYDQHPGLGTWVTVDRSTGVPIGFHLLNHIQGETLIQVGYFLFKSAWGHGYATEMALRLVRYGFVDLGLPQIVAMTGLDNVVSQRVLLKIGLRRHGERAFQHPAYAFAGLQAWFERGAADWLGERELG